MNKEHNKEREKLNKEAASIFHYTLLWKFSGGRLPVALRFQGKKSILTNYTKTIHTKLNE